VNEILSTTIFIMVAAVVLCSATALGVIVVIDWWAKRKH
jgi:hypothetical protein